MRVRRGWRVRADAVTSGEIHGDSPLAAVVVRATPYRLHALIGTIIAVCCGAGFVTLVSPGLATWRAYALLPVGVLAGVGAYFWTVHIVGRYGDRRELTESEPDGRLWRPHLRLIVPVAGVLFGAIAVTLGAQIALVWPHARLGPSCSWITLAAVLTPVYTLWRARDMRSRVVPAPPDGQNDVDYLELRARARDLIRGRHDEELRGALCGEEGRELAARLAEAARVPLLTVFGGRETEAGPLEMALDVYTARAVADHRLAARDAGERSIVVEAAGADVLPVAEFHRLHPRAVPVLGDSLARRYPAYGEEPGPAEPAGTHTIVLDLAPRFAQAWAGDMAARGQVATAIACLRADEGAEGSFADALGHALGGRMDEAVAAEDLGEWERAFLRSLKTLRERLTHETP